jgi:AcrR family transcriptional regulator
LAQRSQRTGARAQDETRRQERAQRILDAAATLILRWGYNKTTIDDVARQAGVAKGTIYLHWKTREDLFEALMRRERVALALDVKQRITDDPAGATLRGMVKHSALALMQRPLLKAVFLRDIDIIGKLARSHHSSAVYLERLAGFTAYLEFLREHGLVRTDLSLRAQIYVMAAVFAGFLLVEPLMPEDYRLADEDLAELLAETVHRTLESDRAVRSDEVQPVSDAFMQYLNRDMTLAQEQYEQRLKS